MGLSLFDITIDFSCVVAYSLESLLHVYCLHQCYLAAMTGNYVNFGVFELYGDRALADVLDISLKMILSISLSDILAYQKVRCMILALL